MPPQRPRKRRHLQAPHTWTDTGSGADHDASFWIVLQRYPNPGPTHATEIERFAVGSKQSSSATTEHSVGISVSTEVGSLFAKFSGSKVLDGRDFEWIINVITALHHSLEPFASP